jgi:hypothetical protein
MKIASATLAVFSVTAAFGATPTVTYSKDVAPILQKNCETCHRAGEAAPMSLRSYKEVRPYAAAIKEAVLLKKMPPWFADPHYGHFSNDRTLSEQDVKTLVAWADSGAKEGDPKDLPKPVAFLNGWNIDKPDLEIEMAQDFKIPASGTIDYQHILVKGNFEKDTWVTQAEVRPGNRALVHHVIAYIREPNSKWMKDAVPGVPYPKSKNEGGEGSSAGQFLVGYAPGFLPTRLDAGRAVLVKAGSDIVLELHYTANGKEGTDRTKVGFVFSKEPVTERVVTLAAANGKFAIPPGDPNYRVDAKFEFGGDAKVISFIPHMHLRGKDMDYRAIYPTGETETLLSVPHYDFSWQLTYKPVKDLVMPKGTVIACTAHYDNSPNNPNNPDPTKVIKYGEQSWDEMMIGFFQVAIPADRPISSILPERKKPAAAPAATPLP